MPKECDIDILIDKFLKSDSVNDMESILSRLKDKRINLPDVLIQKYYISGKWQQRDVCVYYAIPFSRKSEVAIKLGIEALSDKARHVRYHACLLLAWSLNVKALGALRQIATASHDQVTIADARAAIDAIEKQNSNFFADRDHSGKIKLNVMI